jgi:hypothetical protein
MPVRVIEATSRRDIIAYLQQESSALLQTKTTSRSELSR